MPIRRSGPTNGSFGTAFLDYFSKLWGCPTPLHTSRNVRPCLWYTFLVCMGMSIPLLDFVSQKWNSFRQLFEQNSIEKQVFNGTFTLKKLKLWKKIIVEEDWVSKLNWRFSIYILPYTGSRKVLENIPVYLYHSHTLIYSCYYIRSWSQNPPSRLHSFEVRSMTFL